MNGLCQLQPLASAIPTIKKPLSSLSLEVLTVITDHLESVDILSLWSTGEKNIRRRLGRSVMRWVISPDSFIHKPHIAVRIMNLTRFFTNLLDFSLRPCRYQINPLARCSNLQLPQSITELDIHDPEVTRINLPNLSSSFPHLAFLSIGRCSKKHPRFIFPQTLTELRLFEGWEFSERGEPRCITQEMLPKSLTSLIIRAGRDKSYAFSDNWPKSLQNLSFTSLSSKTFPFRGMISGLPRSLQSLDLLSYYDDSYIPVFQEDLVDLPPFLTNFKTNYCLPCKQAPAIFVTLPRSLTHLLVYTDHDSTFYNDMMLSTSLLPSSLKSFGITLPLSVRQQTIFAMSIPRSITHFYKAQTAFCTITLESLPLLPTGLTSLDIYTSLELTTLPVSVPQPQNGDFCRYIPRFTNLQSIYYTYRERSDFETLWRLLPPTLTLFHMTSRSPRPTFPLSLLANLPKHLKKLYLDCFINDDRAVTMPEREADMWSRLLPRGLVGLRLSVVSTLTFPLCVSNTISWWSHLPSTLTHISLSVGTFGHHHMAALAKSCPSLSKIEITVNRRIHTGLHGDILIPPGFMDPILLTTPSSCVELFIDIPEGLEQTCVDAWTGPGLANYLPVVDLVRSSRPLIPFDSPKMCLDTSIWPPKSRIDMAEVCGEQPIFFSFKIASTMHLVQIKEIRIQSGRKFLSSIAGTLPGGCRVAIPAHADQTWLGRCSVANENDIDGDNEDSDSL